MTQAATVTPFPVQALPMTTFRIVHKTEYLYEESASLCYNEVRMLPRSFVQPLLQQQVVETYVVVDPIWGDHRERVDFYGNRVLFYAIRQPHSAMAITVSSLVRVMPQPLLPASRADDAAHSAIVQDRAQLTTLSWEKVYTQLRTDLTPPSLEAREFLLNSPLIAATAPLAAYAAPSFPKGRPLLDAVQDLMGRIYHDFDFVAGATTVATPLSEVLEKRRGVCQDFAQLMVGCLRTKGLAARYVSGYIETLPPPGQEKLQGSDASHAWCAVYLPGVGWFDFDPTNNLVPTDQHIIVGWGRDFADVTPLKGVFFGDGRHQLKVSVDVTRIEG